MGVVGRSVTRLEDRPLVTGPRPFRRRFAFTHMLHMRVVRSAHAHGRIRAIDSQCSAGYCPASWRYGRLPMCAMSRPIDFRLTRSRGAGALSPAHSGATSKCAMSASRSRRCSQPIAYVAEDAADLVAVEIDELAGRARCERGAGRVRRRAIRPSRRSWKNRMATSRRLFAQAHAVVELDLTVGRHSGVPLETRGAIARYDPRRDVLELHGAAKVPHWNRDSIARMLGRDPSTVHLYEGHVGGGFGIRGELYPEDVLVCLAALRLAPSGEMDRGSARAPDRSQSFARSSAIGSAPQSTPTAACSRSTTSSSTTRAVMCAPTPRPCPTLRRRCCQAPIACRPITRSAIFGSPTRRPAAPIARRAASRARSCASG